MDAVTLALAKKYTDSKQIASIENPKLTCKFKEESEINVPFLIYTYRWFSDKMPTPNELKSASVGCWFGAGTQHMGDTFTFSGVFPSSSGVFSTLWGNEYITFPVGVLVAYEAGQHTVTYEGQDYTVEVPRTGLYSMIPDEVFAEALFKNSEYFNIEVAWESVKTIDPKFLPEGIGGGGMKEIKTADHGFTILGAEDPTAVVFPQSFVAEIAELAKTGEPFILVDALGETNVKLSFTSSQYTGDYAGWHCLFVYQATMILMLTYVHGSCTFTILQLATATT